MKSNFLSSCSCAAILIAVAAAAPAVAQSGVNAEVNEIVVTATRSSQALSEVPLSISAFTGDTMDSQGIKDITDLSRIAPGVTFDTTRTTTNISIRGINSTAGAATTGIYIDDVPIQSRTLDYGFGNAYPQVFDLDRIEVLRGPQGTLFGGGSMGGTVRFITPQPNLTTYEMYGRAELSETDHGDPSYEAGLAIGGPIVKDQLGFRVSGWYRRDGGFIDDTSYPSQQTIEKNANWSTSGVLKAAVTFSPTDDLKITPSVYYQNVFRNNNNFFWTNFSDPGAGKFNQEDPNRNSGRDAFTLPSISVDYTTKWAEIVGVASYLNRKNDYNVDYTTFDYNLFTGSSFPGLPGQNAESAFQNSQQNYTGELRAQSVESNSNLHWVVGAFWSTSDQTAVQKVADDYFATYIQQAFGAPYIDIFGVPLINGDLIYDQTAKTLDHQVAGFGQLDYKLFDAVTLTAGLRVAKSAFKIQSSAGGPVLGPLAVDYGRESDTPVTPKFGVEYQIDKNDMAYFSAAKGYRPGGYNPGVGVGCTPQLNADGLAERPPLYTSDSVWSYELGTKNKLFDNKVQLQASVYQIDWSNLQQIVALSSCGFQYIANLGTATSRGFDLQGQVRIVPGLTLSGSLAYTDAVFNQTIFAGPTATTPVIDKGDHVAAPPVTATIAMDYRFVGLQDRESFVRVEYDYRSHQSSVTPATDPLIGDPTIPNQPASSFLQVRAGMQFGPTEVSIFANNLLNETAWTSLTHDTASSILFREATLRPLTVGVSAVLRY